MGFGSPLVVSRTHDHLLSVGRPGVIASTIIPISAAIFGHDLGITPDGVQIRAPRWRCIPAGVARVLVGEEKIAQVEMTALVTVGVVPELGTDFRAYPGRDIVGV